MAQNDGTRNYLRLIEMISSNMKQMEYVNSVTTGDLFEIDLNKTTLFPLVHIIVNNVTLGDDSGIMNYNVTIMAMDIVNDFKGEDQIDDPLLFGEDNEQFVLNNTLTTLNKLNEFLYRGRLHNGNFEIVSAGSCEPFFDRFENRLAGWSYTATIAVNNNIDICSTI